MRVDGFNKRTGIFIITYHVLLPIALFWYFWNFTPSIAMMVTTFLLYVVTGLSITAGYHRYYSHTTYKTNPIVERVILFFGSMATQSSALRWAFEHRLHHAFVDTDRDPYSVKKGFWYAHILWLFKKPAPIDNKVVADLVKNPLVMFQHNHYLSCMLGSNIIGFLLVGWLLNDFVGAFVLSWWTRLFFLHHSTWFINSLAHTWGAHSFSKEQSAVDNYFISFLTFGEGYHNYHHAFANDYRNGIRWYHFDPTKWLIWTLSRLGLAHGLKRVHQYHVKERIMASQKEALLSKIQSSFVARKEELSEKVCYFYDTLANKISHARELIEKYTHSKKAKDQDNTRKLKGELKSVKRSIRADWRLYKEFVKSIFTLPPSPSSGV